MIAAPAPSEGWFAVSQSFDLNVCLNSGQAFAWFQRHDGWIGTIKETAFALRQAEGRLFFHATFASALHASRPTPHALLRHYLALDEDHEKIRRSLPQDPFLQTAMQFGAGLRILRQDPWECLAGFILSSTKQIVHIQQIWRKMSARWGIPLRIQNAECRMQNIKLKTEAALAHGISDSAPGTLIIHSFPEPDKIAALSEKDLRACGMGFRAPYMLQAAQAIADGRLNLASLRDLPTAEARIRLMQLHGVGGKIADCALLFSLGKTEAFPVDTWILKVLRKIYFRNKRRVKPAQLRSFATSHFGPHGGLAQQFLFHYARMNPHLF